MRYRKFVLLILSVIFLMSCSDNEGLNTNDGKEDYLEQLVILQEENIILRNQLEDLENKYVEINKQLEGITIDIAEIKETTDVNTYKAKELLMNMYEIYNKLGPVENFVDEVAGYEELDGYIKTINVKENYITLDQCEFLGFGDERRLIELGYDPEHDLPGAFLIHNPSEKTEKYLVKDTTKYIVYEYNQEYVVKEISFEMFFKRESDRSRFYHVKILNDVVLEMFEVYLP